MITAIGLNFLTKQDRRLAAEDILAAFAAGEFVWVDCAGEPADAVAPLLAALGFSPEAISQALDPKVGGYHPFPEELYVSFEDVDETDDLEIRRLEVLVSDRALAMIHSPPSPVVRRILATYREDFVKFSRSHGFLIYEIAAHLAQSYRDGLRRISDAVEQAQLELFRQSDDTIFPRAAGLTRRILTLRKAMFSTREVLREMAARQSPFLPESTRPSLDLMAGTLERLGLDLSMERDGLAETLNLHMGMVSHRTSQAMRKLTVLSAVFLPLTFLCGVYGMNSSSIPEVQSPYFYAGFWLFCLLLAGVLITLMRRARWW